MVISQIVLGKKQIGNSYSAFADDIFNKYKKTNKYVYDGVTLTFLWPRQEPKTNVQIAYQLILQKLYFLTHNTILVNKKEILQGITISLERQLERMRTENSAEFVRLTYLIRQIKGAQDRESLLRIAHEILNHSDNQVLAVSQTKFVDSPMKSHLSKESVSQVIDKMTNNVLEGKTIKTFEMLQNLNKAQFEKMQQFFMEMYEKHQFLQLAEDRKNQMDVVTDLAYMQANNVVIKRYFKRLQSMFASQSMQSDKIETPETIFEQQKNLLLEIYAESTKQEKKEFVSYLEGIDRAKYKALKTSGTDRATNQEKNAVPTKLTTEGNEKVTKNIEAELTQKVVDKRTDIFETELTKEIVNKEKHVFETGLIKEVVDKNNLPERAINETLTDKTAKKEVNGQQTVIHPSKKSINQPFKEMTTIANSELAESVNHKIAKTFEMLQTLNERQLQKIQQLFMERYERQQLAYLTETKENQTGIVTGLAHVQINSAVMQHYFEKLQSMLVSQSVQFNKIKTPNIIFEQQKKLLLKVYTESTTQEKEEFATYLEKEQWIDKVEDKIFRTYKTNSNSSIVNQEKSVFDAELSKEITNQEKGAFETKLTKESISRKETINNLLEKTADETLTDKQAIMYTLIKQASKKTTTVTSSELTESVKHKIAKTFEMLQTLNETQFQEMQQLFIEGYEKQQFSYLAKTAEGRMDNLTHIQKNLYNSIIDRYFRKLQPMLTSQSNKINVPETLLELQRNLLLKVYAESTTQEKEEFISYLEKRQWIDRIADKVFRKFKTRPNGDAINQEKNAFAAELTKEALNKTQFQEMQQLFMESAEGQQFPYLVKTTESQIGGLTHVQKYLYNSIIDRYIQRLQFIHMSKSTLPNEIDTSKTILEQQRNRLLKGYAKSTTQEKKEFATYLDKRQLIYETQAQTVREFADKETPRIYNAAQAQTLRKFADKEAPRIYSVAQTRMLREFKNKSFINRSFQRLQPLPMLELAHKHEKNLQKIIWEWQRNQLVKKYIQDIEQSDKMVNWEKREHSISDMHVREGLAKKFDVLSKLESWQNQSLFQIKKIENPTEETKLFYLTSKREKENLQQNEMKIQKIVEHCAKQTTRLARHITQQENETMKRQIDDQKNEICQLKTQLQNQYNQINEQIQTSNWMPHIDKMYQEIEKRMESRLRLERLRRGM